MNASMRGLLQRLLGIKPAEWEGALFFFFVVVGFAFGSSIARSIGMTLLVEHLGGAVLPKVFIIIDSIAFFGFLVYGRYTKKLGELPIFNFLLLCGALFSLAGQFLFLLPYNWVYGFFFIGFFLIYIFISIHLGSVLGAYFTTVQLKRLTGFINAGLPIGGMLGGGTLVVLLQFFPPHWLAWVMGVAFLLSAWMLYHLNRRLSPVRSGRGTFKDVKPVVEELRGAFGYILREPLLIYMTFGLVLFVVTSKVLEYQYQALIYPEVLSDPTIRATFFATYDVFANAIWLLLQLFFTSRIIVALGVGASNLIHPLMVGVVSILLLLNFSFAPAVIAQFVNQEMRQAIRAPTFNLLFSAISPNLWGTTKAFLNGVVFSLATLVSSFSLLLLEANFEVSVLIVVLPVITLIFAVLGVGAAIPQWFAYNRGVFGLLNRRLFAEDTRKEGKTLHLEKALRSELEDPDPQNVIVALGMIRIFQLKSCIHPVGKLLSRTHDTEIKRHCVDTLAGLPYSEASVTYLLRTLKFERDPATLALILKNMRQAGLQAPEMVAPVEHLLLHPAPEVFVQSCLYLYTHPACSAHKSFLETRILRRLQNPDLPSFALYLYALGELRGTRYSDYVEPFLESPQAELRSAALKAYIQLLEGRLNAYKHRFIKALDSPAKEIKILALQALRECSPPHDWRPIIHLLGSKDHILIAEALELLRLRLNSCRPALIAEVFKPTIPVEEKFEILALVYPQFNHDRRQRLLNDGEEHFQRYIEICILQYLYRAQEQASDLSDLVLKILSELGEEHLLHALTAVTYASEENREFFQRVGRGLQSSSRANQGNALEVLSNVGEKYLSRKVVHYFEEHPETFERFSIVYRILFGKPLTITVDNYKDHLRALAPPLLEACLLYMEYNQQDKVYDGRDAKRETLTYLDLPATV